MKKLYLLLVSLLFLFITYNHSFAYDDTYFNTFDFSQVPVEYSKYVYINNGTTKRLNFFKSEDTINFYVDGSVLKAGGVWDYCFSIYDNANSCWGTITPHTTSQYLIIINNTDSSYKEQNINSNFIGYQDFSIPNNTTNILDEVKSDYMFTSDQELAMQNIMNYVYDNYVFNDYIIYSTEHGENVYCLIFPENTNLIRWIKDESGYKINTTNFDVEDVIGIKQNVGAGYEPEEFDPVCGGNEILVSLTSDFLYFWSDGIYDDYDNEESAIPYYLFTTTPSYITVINNISGVYVDKLASYEYFKVRLNHKGNYRVSVIDVKTNESKMYTDDYDSLKLYPCEYTISNTFLNTLDRDTDYAIKIYDKQRDIEIYSTTFRITLEGTGIVLNSPDDGKEYVLAPIISYVTYGFNNLTYIDIYINDKLFTSRSAVQYNKYPTVIEIPKYQNNGYTIAPGINKVTLKHHDTGEVLKEVSFHIELFEGQINETTPIGGGTTQPQEVNFGNLITSIVQGLWAMLGVIGFIPQLVGLFFFGMPIEFLGAISLIGLIYVLKLFANFKP
jgi:hypothetical protein